MGIGDINGAHLAPNVPLLPATPPAPKSEADALKPPEEKQRETIAEVVDTRPLLRLQEEQDARQEDAPPEEEPASPEAHAVLRNDDTELTLIQAVRLPTNQLLEEIHEKWYEAYDEQHVPLPDVKVGTRLTQDVIRTMKHRVLAGCTLVFSGLIPLGEQPER